MRRKISKPMAWERRVRRGFLFLPRTLNCEWRWLEWANIEQEYGYFGGWTDVGWADD